MSTPSSRSPRCSTSSRPLLLLVPRLSGYHVWLRDQRSVLSLGVERAALSKLTSPGPPAHTETPELMPITLMLSHKLNKKMADLRRSGELGWLRPDSKTQVTVEYEKKANGAFKPLRVDTVVISTQHAEEISTEDLQKELMDKVVKTVIPADLLDDKTVFHIQPSGRFVIGGPQGDAGLTGRKIIVDTYGGASREYEQRFYTSRARPLTLGPVSIAHGGGAFSGKDWSSESPPPRCRSFADTHALSGPVSCERAGHINPFPPHHRYHFLTNLLADLVTHLLAFDQRWTALPPTSRASSYVPRAHAPDSDRDPGSLAPLFR